MKKIDIVKQTIKELLQDGPKLSSECLEILQSFSHQDTITKAKKELNIQSKQAANGKWYWYDPEVKMDRRQMNEWLKQNNSEEEEEDELTNEVQELFKENYTLTKQDPKTGATVTWEHYDNPYQWLEENSIYYFDHEDNFSLLTNYNEEWGKALRRNPQRIETFKQLSELDPNNLPSMLDTDGNEDEALKWMIVSNNWIEESKVLMEENKDKKYKTQIREEEQENREHHKAFVDYYGYDYKSDIED